MAECFICGISDEKAQLFDVISDKGIKKICQQCNHRENLPLVKRGFVEEAKPLTVYERLSRAAGIKPEDMRKPVQTDKKQDESLRGIVEKNYKKNLPQTSTQNYNLIENFHWVLMRVRRARHLTQKQLADAILEPEIAIKMAEQGVLPANSDRLIQKIEKQLGVKLTKGEAGYFMGNEPLKVQNLEPLPEPKIENIKEKKGFTIGDLRFFKKLREKKEKNKEGEIPAPGTQEESKKELSDDEINRALFEK